MEGTKANLDSPQAALQWCAEQCMERGWRIAYSLLQNTSDAQDAVQQAFLVAARKPGRIPLDDPWPWLATVIALEARNVRRKFQRPRVSLREGDEPVPEGNSEPRQEAEKRELTRRLHAALDNLPDNEREALVLTQLSGMTYTQAAAALEVPLGTLNHRVSRGLANLRLRLNASDASILSCLPFLPVTKPPAELRAFLDAQLGAAAGGLALPATIAIAGIMMKKNVVLLALLMLALLVASLTAVVWVTSTDASEQAAKSGDARPDAEEDDQPAPAEVDRAFDDGRGADPDSSATDTVRTDSSRGADEPTTPDAVEGEPEEGEAATRRDVLDQPPPLTIDQGPPRDPRIMLSIGTHVPWTSRDTPKHILVSPDDTFLVVAGDNFVQRLDAATGNTEWSASLAEGSVTGIALSPDGRLLAVATNYTQLPILDPATGELIRSVKSGASISSVAFSNDGSRLAMGYRSTIKCVHLESLEPDVEASFGGLGHHFSEVAPVQFSKDDTKILAAVLRNVFLSSTKGLPGELRVFESGSGRASTKVRGGPEGIEIQGSVAFTPNGQRAVASAIDRDGYVMSYEEFRWEHPATIPAGTSQDEAEAIARRHFASLEKKYKEYLNSKGYAEPPAGDLTKVFAAVINLESGAVERRLHFGEAKERRLRLWVSNDGSSLVVWDGKRLHIHDCTTWAHRATAELPTTTGALAFNSSADVFYCNDGFRIRRFRVSDGIEIAASQASGLKPDGKHLSLSPDGSLLVFTDSEGLVAYDVNSGKVRWTRASTIPAASENSFTADGTGLYASGGDDRRPMILDAYTGELKQELGWPDGISRDGRLAVSGDGRTCAAIGSAEADGLSTKVVLWRESDDYVPVLLSAAGEPGEPEINISMLSELSLSYDGKYGATAAWKGYLLWNFETRRASAIHRAGGFSNNMRISFNPDGREFVAISLGTRRGYTRVNVETGVETDVDVSSLLEDEDAAFNGMLIAPDGESLLLSPYDWHAVPTLYRVDLKTGAFKDSYPGHVRTVNQMAQSRDGSIMASIGDNGVIYVWRTG